MDLIAAGLIIAAKHIPSQLRSCSITACAWNEVATVIASNVPEEANTRHLACQYCQPRSLAFITALFRLRISHERALQYCWWHGRDIAQALKCMHWCECCHALPPPAILFLTTFANKEQMDSCTYTIQAENFAHHVPHVATEEAEGPSLVLTVVHEVVPERSTLLCQHCWNVLCTQCRSALKEHVLGQKQCVIARSASDLMTHLYFIDMTLTVFLPA